MQDLLGLDAAPEGTATPPDITIRCLNLDEDPEAECVFILHLGPSPASIFLVSDHKSDGWYVVGQFGYWWHWKQDDAEHFVELHPPYILVREIGGGTGVAGTDAKVYRLWRGALYKTIGFEERGYAAVYGTSPLQTRTVENQIKFCDLNFSPWGGLTLRGWEETSFTNAAGKEVRKAVTTKSCSAYEWVPATFSFERTTRATKEACR